ncbi:hypothetical protein ACVWOM_30215, partial [Pseudomonas aeruginosa]
IHATTWMSFEQITLSGRSQTNNSLYMKCPEQANNGDRKSISGCLGAVEGLNRGNGIGFIWK